MPTSHEQHRIITPPARREVVVRLRDVTRVYAGAGDDVRALDNVSFDIDKGEWLSIMGPSGSGKTTLLNLLACLDQPTAGTVEIAGTDIGALDARALTVFRREKIGLIFQQFHLVPHLTAVENVMLAQYFHSMADESEARAALTRVGLGERLHHLPRQLSGGEQQRVCIARALINQPAIILADEPTGNLDEKNQKLVLQLFEELHRDGHTLIVVTHDLAVGERAERRIQLEHGKIMGAYLTHHQGEEYIDEILEHMWVLREDNQLSLDALQTLGEFAHGAFVRNMEERGLIALGEGHIDFRPAGEQRAHDIIRRHRLAEKLFQDTFKMSDEVAEAEACRFEHILEPAMTESICNFLAHPRACPHGKPIPPGRCCK